MGDAENTLPPSKKRAAGRELSRDNPGLDDEDEDVCDQEAGTFKRASEEVLANRKIVKVRRNRTPSAPSAPSSNPFASICLIPPTASASSPATVANVQETTETACEAVESQDDAKKESGKEEDDGNQQPADEEKHDEVDSDARKPESADAKKETESNGIENDENKIPESVSFSSFQQLSSSQNAFTGLIGTGFSSSSSSFGSITKNDQPAFPSFSFGSNGNPSLFPNSGAPEGRSKIPTTEEVQVETGEENEKTVFAADSVLFEFLDNGWKERGKGEVKVNVSRTGSGKGRLVMRSKGNYRLILNANIFADMKMTKMEKKGITFACLNSNGEGQDGLSTFALKFKDAAIVEEFCGMVTEHKGNNNNVPLKTPENSPKGLDE